MADRLDLDNLEFLVLQKTLAHSAVNFSRKFWQQPEFRGQAFESLLRGDHRAHAEVAPIAQGRGRV